MIKKVLLTALVSGALLVPIQGEAVATTPTIDAKATAGPVVLPPKSSPFGQTYGQWSADWWQKIAAIPAASNPLGQQGQVTCDVGRGHVTFLVGTLGGDVQRACTVAPGTALLLPMVNGICAPVLGDKGDIRKCATDLGDSISIGDLNLTVDGKSVTGLAQFRFASPDFSLSVPADNVFGVAAGSSLAVADGYWVMLKPLTPGVHTISFGGTATTSGGNFSTQATYEITVK